MLRDRLRAARDLSWAHHGKSVTFYLPGMFNLRGITGKYPAASITGGECAFSCEHCKGTILRSMLPAKTPEALLTTARRLSLAGQHGMLVSGGCDPEGRLPWREFAPVVRRIKEETGLIVSAHVGFPSAEQAVMLKEAGVDQVLVDVIGDEDTLHDVYHAPFGLDRMREALRVLDAHELSVVPHVVCGLHFGSIRGELKALDMIAEYEPEQLVIVSLMPLPGTSMRTVKPPSPVEVAGVIAHARMLMPQVPTSLGCARQRGSHQMEMYALQAGINRMALPSPEAVELAEAMGLAIRYQKTCCSVRQDLSASSWDAQPVFPGPMNNEKINPLRR